MAPFQNAVCDTSTRRQEIEKAQTIQGIDYVEVVTSPPADDERVLHVFFIPKDPANVTGQTNLTLLMQKLAIAPQEISIQGGVRIQNLKVLGVAFVVDHVEVRVSEPGDFSDYTLVINDPAIDPFYSQVQFNFKAGCPSHFDCRPAQICPPLVPVEPDIDYMAKDYASFRRALLDLIPTWKPSWTERHEADIGMALVELLAYTGDQLSYYQDAVSNELYLDTARQRISVRRQARLIDYAMHDGASARTFVHLQLALGTTGLLPARTQVLTRITTPVGTKLPPLPPSFTSSDSDAALAATNAIFETFNDANLSSDLNEITIYTWDNSLCCLPQGATSIYLKGDLAFDPTAKPPDAAWKLKPGDFLLFEETLGVATGLPADADPAHRQVVRLTAVESTQDKLGTDPAFGKPAVKLTHVTWDTADALTFPLCISTKLANGSVQQGVSVARGNLVLADHGQTVGEWFPGNPIDPNVPGIIVGPRPFRFRLQQGPLSFRIPPVFNAPLPAVAQLLSTDPQTARPQVTLDVHTDTQVIAGWNPVPTLLESRALSTDFAVETENDGSALLRFGDGVYGLNPPAGSHIFVQYRIGVGTQGNVGADSLAHVINQGTPNFPSLTAVRNPLAAWGGIDPQPLEQVKLNAPAALRALQYRAVTEDDYAQVAERSPDVAHAVATFRWTGSWYTVFITIDPVGRNDVPPDMADRVRAWVTQFTQAGYDLEINAPLFVPLDVVIDVCVKPYHFRGDVEQAVLNALSNRVFPDGSRGFFYPGKFSFGQPLYLSQLYAAVTAVEGVDSAAVTQFQRWGKLPNHELQQGYIPMDRLEIVRLDNDPNFPENGILRLNMGGGK
jgi:hypothetical protein